MNMKGLLFEATCRQLYAHFFGQYPNGELQELTDRALAALLKREADFSGQAAGWAAGIVYAVGSMGCGVPGVLNADFEKAFGTTMSTARKRAAEVKCLLEGAGVPTAAALTFSGGWTLRDEANAMCAYAFRNGFIEDIHASGRITDPEMKKLMIEASAGLARLLERKRNNPMEYEQFIRDYHRRYCRQWER